MRSRPFAQVDVFSTEPYLGNPLAVILDATDIPDSELQRIARWTNLSETAFVLPPTQSAAEAGADYRVRIFTPDGEIPFAGHPTLGTAHAWLEHGGVPQSPGHIIQECKVGLVDIRSDLALGSASPESSSLGSTSLAFTAPPTLRQGPLSEDDLHRICAAVNIDRNLIIDHQWVVNGPEWPVVMLPTAQDVLDLRPDFSAHPDLMVGVIGPYPEGSDAAFEVRGFAPVAGIPEDPVTGSLNASIGQWLLRTNQVSGPYTASQGTVLHRSGQVHIIPTPDRENVLVGGAVTTLIRGTVVA